MAPGASVSRILFAILLLSTTLSHAATASNGVTFLYPTGDPTFYHLDTIAVQYISPFPKPLLYTFCTSPKSGSVLTMTQQDANPYNATTNVFLNFTNGVSSCWFDLRPNTTAGDGGNSDTFTFIDTQRSQTTESSGSGTGSSTSALPTATGSPSPSASNTSVQANGVGKNGLSTGAKAGIAIGAFIAGIALSGLAFALLRWRKRRRLNRGAQEMRTTVDGSMPLYASSMPVFPKSDVPQGQGLNVQQNIGVVPVPSMQELLGREKYEMPGREHAQPQELEGS